MEVWRPRPARVAAATAWLKLLERPVFDLVEKFELGHMSFVDRLAVKEERDLTRVRQSVELGEVVKNLRGFHGFVRPPGELDEHHGLFIEIQPHVWPLGARNPHAEGRPLIESDLLKAAKLERRVVQRQERRDPLRIQPVAMAFDLSSAHRPVLYLQSTWRAAGAAFESLFAVEYASQRDRLTADRRRAF